MRAATRAGVGPCSRRCLARSVAHSSSARYGWPPTSPAPCAQRRLLAELLAEQELVVDEVERLLGPKEDGGLAVEIELRRRALAGGPAAALVGAQRFDGLVAGGENGKGVTHCRGPRFLPSPA